MSHCLYCGQPISFLARLRGEDRFCSARHRELFREESDRLAMRALQRTAEGGMKRPLGLTARSGSVSEPPLCGCAPAGIAPLKGGCTPVSDPPEAAQFAGGAALPPFLLRPSYGDLRALCGRPAAISAPGASPPDPPRCVPEPEWIEFSCDPLPPGLGEFPRRPPEISAGVLPIVARPASGATGCRPGPQPLRWTFRPPEAFTGHALLRLAAACAHALLPLPVTPVFGGLEGGRACSAEPALEISSPALARRDPAVFAPALATAGLRCLTFAGGFDTVTAGAAPVLEPGLEFAREESDPAIPRRFERPAPRNLEVSDAIELPELPGRDAGTAADWDRSALAPGDWIGWDAGAAAPGETARSPFLPKLDQKAWPPRAPAGLAAAGAVAIPFHRSDSASLIPASRGEEIHGTGFSAVPPVAPQAGLGIERRKSIPAAALRRLPPVAVVRTPPPETPPLPPALPGNGELPDILAFVPADLSAAVPLPVRRAGTRRCPLAREAVVVQALEFRPPKRLFAGVFVPQWRSLPLRPRICFGPSPPAAAGRPDGTGSRTPASVRPDSTRWSVRSA